MAVVRIALYANDADCNQHWLLLIVSTKHLIVFVKPLFLEKSTLLCTKMLKYIQSIILHALNSGRMAWMSPLIHAWNKIYGDAALCVTSTYHASEWQVPDQKEFPTLPIHLLDLIMAVGASILVKVCQTAMRNKKIQ